MIVFYSGSPSNGGFHQTLSLESLAKKNGRKNQFVKSLPRPGWPQKVLLPYPAPRNLFLETVLKLDRLMQFCVDLDFQVNKEHSVEKHLSSLVAHATVLIG